MAGVGWCCCCSENSAATAGGPWVWPAGSRQRFLKVRMPRGNSDSVDTCPSRPRPCHPRSGTLLSAPSVLGMSGTSTDGARGPARWARTGNSIGTESLPRFPGRNARSTSGCQFTSSVQSGYQVVSFSEFSAKGQPGGREEIKILAQGSRGENQEGLQGTGGGCAGPSVSRASHTAWRMPETTAALYSSLPDNRQLRSTHSQAQIPEDNRGQSVSL